MAKGRKTGGRRPGSTNKVTSDLRAMILGALDAAGGQKYFQLQARENPQAFLSLVSKLVSKDVNIAANVVYEIVTGVPRSRHLANEHAESRTH